jgi:hypothetical protein
MAPHMNFGVFGVNILQARSYMLVNFVTNCYALVLTFVHTPETN